MMTEILLNQEISQNEKLKRLSFGENLEKKIKDEVVQLILMIEEI